LALKLAQT
jgi:hypothetical protein